MLWVLMIDSVRSFTALDPWVMSFPVIAAIMCLLSHPDKASIQNDTENEYLDRDMAWCMDSLHGFCRLVNPEESPRPLAYSLGTYRDGWMYLQFTLHAFSAIRDLESFAEEKVEGSGMLPERRLVMVPGVGTFREGRVWVAVRTATGTTETSVSPSSVVVIVSDFGHIQLGITEKDWTERGLATPVGAAGVALFQMLVWSQVARWEYGWEACLKYMDEVLEVKVR
jgi:hypothetical protein